MPLLNGVMDNNDTLSTVETIKDAQGADLQLRETIYGKAGAPYHVLVTEQMQGNGYLTVQFMSNRTGAVLKTASENPDRADDYACQLRGYSGAQGNLRDLVPELRTAVFETVLNVI